nr:glycoside hydrolase family 38 C-terminal domain-containing protein [Candidatus Sigynarchaeota archaeon]
GKTTPAENWRVPDISAVFAKWKPNDAYYQYEFVVSDVPALGFKVYYMMAVEDEPAKADTSWAKVIKGKAAKIENQLLAVTINANGTFDLLDKQSGLTYKDCCSFIDEPDYGDEYDFVRMPENHVIHQSRQAKADVKEIVVRGSRVMATVSVPFTIPDALNPDRKAQSAKKIDLLIELTITLNDNSRRVDVKIVVNNKAKDHRLRVAVPSGIATDSKLFQQHFCVLKKSLKIPEGKNWTQKPAPTEFHDHFFGVAGTRDGKEAGLVVISRDAQQHEVNEKDFGINSLILTLYRAVGWLGRPGQGAGPDVPTPDAQCLFPMEFNMAILPFEPCKTGKAQFCIPDEVFSNIEQFVNPLLPVVLRTFNDFRNTDPLPALLDYKRIDMPKITLVDEHNEEFLKQEKLVDPVAGFISIEPSCLLFSSFKKADAGDGYILRFYNLCRDDRDATIKVHPALGLAKAEEVKLDEITLVKKHEVSFSKNTAVVKKIGHDEIVTLKFKT